MGGINIGDIVLYEEITMNAHPALKAQLYDGWVLRFSDGYTKRANSVSPLYPSRLPPGEKVEVCEDMYAGQGLPTVFKLTNGSAEGLDVLLEARGYVMDSPTWLFVNNTLPSGDDDTVTVCEGINPIWQEDFFRLNGISGADSITVGRMLNNIQCGVLSGHIVEGGKTVACGLCTVERGYAGLYDIVVDKACRRQGYGYRLCRALLAEAGKIGGRTAYLQVVEANTPAVSLYRKLGYRPLYKYWYRVKK